ncbi:MAG: hypothetical protein ACI8S6_000235 [Myxococcota bacterium]|jgi:hypothetical protein
MSSNGSSRDGLGKAVKETDAEQGSKPRGSRQFDIIDQAREAMLESLTAALGSRDALNSLRDLAGGSSAVLPAELSELLLDVAHLQVKTVTELSTLSARFTAQIAKAIREKAPSPAQPLREELLMLDGQPGATVSGPVDLENRFSRPLVLELPSHLLFHGEDGRLPAPARFHINGAETRTLTLPAADGDSPAVETVALSLTIDPLRFSEGRYTALLELSVDGKSRNNLNIDLVVRSACA